MQVTEAQATAFVKAQFPDSDVKSPIVYRGVYLFQVFQPNPTEGDQDPFWSVNIETGEFRDFNVITDGHPAEIAELYAAKRGITNG